MDRKTFPFLPGKFVIFQNIEKLIITDWFQDQNNLYFVMEYIPGGDLMSLLIKKGIFPEPLAKYVDTRISIDQNAGL